MNAMPVGVVGNSSSSNSSSSNNSNNNNNNNHSSSIRSQPAQSSQQNHGQTKIGRRLLVIRHGERIDFTFNVTHDNWVIKAFDDDGRYKRFNINMPRTLPTRKDGHQNFMSDTPLTEMGYLQAKITGRALKDVGWKPTYVYASPAYRSVQTAVGILKGLCSQDVGKLQINIEPGLFEWGAWFRPKLPLWMSSEEFALQGYPINTSYKPVVNRSEITPTETLYDYYNRSNRVSQRILERHQEDGVVMFVAHGASLDTCTRQLTGESPRNQQEFYTLLHQTPYLAVAAVQEEHQSKSWRLTEPPISPFQHQGNASYDWRLLTAQHVEKN